MDTTLLIKLKKDVKDKASTLAGEIGIPLSTLISAFLKNLIRERRLTLTAEPEVSKAKIKKWEKMIREYKKNPTKHKKFTSAEDLCSYLNI
jgi:antitoxin component of RelBE/YafQ-DinJ toxin-antitoxin module